MKDEAEGEGGITGRTQQVAARGGPRANLRSQGLRTRKLIVRAATRLLLESGGLDFTMRAVARRAKISVSNLQYYFPDRQELLRAVMAPSIDAYLAELKLALNGNVPPREALLGLLERQMRDVRDRNARTLWSHFATLANVDPECARLFEEWYVALVHGIAKLVVKINPEFGPAASLQMAALIIAMGDGLGYIMQTGEKQGYTRGLDAKFPAVVDVLLRHGPVVTSDKAGKL